MFNLLGAIFNKRVTLESVERTGSYVGLQFSSGDVVIFSLQNGLGYYHQGPLEGR